MVDYFEGALSPTEDLKVRRHLDACAPCRKIFSDSGAVIRLAASSIPLQPNEAFWKDFDASLSRKLDDLASNKEARRAHPVFALNPRPALVALSLAVVVIAIGVRVLPMMSIYQMNKETELVNEVVLLDEVAPNGDNKDTGLDDMLMDAALLNDIDAS
jgi:hypothetical protein